mmetsp:Transcript_17933/g.51004  ORF Transcript_17933/g.51004 Transcript_17933/m.51004 type:complete len:205 (+) Transcript_17933:892-1506(+)
MRPCVCAASCPPTAGRSAPSASSSSSSTPRTTTCRQYTGRSTALASSGEPSHCCTSPTQAKAMYLYPPPLSREAPISMVMRASRRPSWSLWLPWCGCRRSLRPPRSCWKGVWGRTNRRCMWSRLNGGALKHWLSSPSRLSGTTSCRQRVRCAVWTGPSGPSTSCSTSARSTQPHSTPYGPHLPHKNNDSNSNNRKDSTKTPAVS